MLIEQAKKFTKVVTINLFEILREAVAAVVDFQITVNPKWLVYTQTLLSNQESKTWLL